MGLKQLFVYFFAFNSLLYSQDMAHPALSFDLIDNRPFIEVKLNNSSKTYYFVLDCAAVNVIDLTLAKELKLELENYRKIQGVGANDVDSYEVILEQVTFGSFELSNERFYSSDLSEIRENLHLPYFDGIIGYDFFKNYIIEFDYSQSLFKLHNAFSSDGGIAFELFHDQIPKIKVNVDGHSGEFIVDTGDRSDLTVRRHFFNRLPDDYVLSDTTITGYSIGGALKSQQTIIKKLNLGKGLTFYNIPARILAMSAGRFSREDIDGSIGGGILKNGRLIIDYKSQQIYIK